MPQHFTFKLVYIYCIPGIFVAYTLTLKQVSALDQCAKQFVS